MNYFIYNNISSDAFGIRIISKNVFSSPKFDTSLVSIPGRDGDLITSNNRFPNITVSYSCYVYADTIDSLNVKLRNIKKWLYQEPDRYHNLTDTYDSDFIRKALFNSKLDITDQFNKAGLFTISFTCKPFRILDSSLTPIPMSTGDTLFNPYPFKSLPYLKIIGSGNGTLTIQSSSGNKTWTFTGINQYIECDSELMNFYKGNTAQNNIVTGDGFPEFSTGNNTISFTGGITSVQVTPRWACL